MIETTVEFLKQRANLQPDRLAIEALPAGGAQTRIAMTWADWADSSAAFAASLVAAGHVEGGRVAVLAGNRPLWPVADLGTLFAGGVSVGIYPTSSPVQIAHIIRDSGATVAVVDSAYQLAKLLSVRATLPGLRTIICEEAAGAGVVGWLDWLTEGRTARRGAAGREVNARTNRLHPRADALLIYTSGSTGEPKGARVSHEYLTAAAKSIGSVLELSESDSSLSFLPFCHAAERVFGLHTRIVFGMATGLVEDHARLWEAARAFRPTIFGGVPRFFEKVWEELHREADGFAPAVREEWLRALCLGRQLSRARRTGSEEPEAIRSEWMQISGAHVQRLRNHLGGRVRVATSGGAVFPPHVAEDLDALGLTVLAAYGLTEHLCVAFNRQHRYSFDSAGPPMPGTEIRIAGDGEIMIRRTSLTFSGYHGAPEATAASFSADGEWLLTGDLGVVGDDGFLRVTGRKKELIALSNGKKVAPLPIEGLVGRHPWVEQAVVVGEGRSYLSALITLRSASVTSWARGERLDMDFSELLTHPRVTAEVQKAIDSANELLSRPEQIRRFDLLDRGLSVEAEELTPTLKVRREVVVERYRDRVDALYGRFGR
ncbi:AMP-dependent synthetase/ligase [soil metagenome]